MLMKSRVIIAIIISILLLNGCSKAEEEYTPVYRIETVTNSDISLNNYTIKEEESSSIVIRQEELEPIIDKRSLLDNEIATVEVTDLEHDPSYKCYVVNLNIKNNAECTLGYSVSYIEVNGYTLSCLAYGDIYSGMSSNVEVGISDDELSLCSIDPIQTIKFTLVLYNDETKETYEELEVYLETSLYGKATKELNFGGEKVYDEDGIIIYAKLMDNPTITTPIAIYIVNETNNPISVSYKNVAINDLMVVDSMSAMQVNSNSKAVNEMYIFYFGETPDIEDIESVTTSFLIFPIIDGYISTATCYTVGPYTLK